MTEATSAADGPTHTHLHALYTDICHWKIYGTYSHGCVSPCYVLFTWLQGHPMVSRIPFALPCGISIFTLAYHVLVCFFSIFPFVIISVSHLNSLNIS